MAKYHVQLVRRRQIHRPQLRRLLTIPWVASRDLASFSGRVSWHLCEIRRSAKTAKPPASVTSIAEVQSIGQAGANTRTAIAKGDECVMSAVGHYAMLGPPGAALMAALERPLSADSGNGDDVVIVGELFSSIPKTGAPQKPNDTR